MRKPGGKQHSLGKDIAIGALGGVLLGGVVELANVGGKAAPARQRTFLDFNRFGMRELGFVGAIGGIVAASVGRTRWILVDKEALRSP
ncbi:MAG: hypothetical protein ACRENU_00100 [Gemmatimonadaceae bacterium]